MRIVDLTLPINRDTTLDAQTWILHAQCAREIAAANATEAVVCDRSVLDNYAYLVHAVGRADDMEPWIRRWCGTYAGLFKVPVWQTPAFDGTRDTDLAFQKEIDETLDGLIDAFRVKAVRLAPGNPNGWVGEILKALGLPAVSPQGQLFPGRESG